MQVQTTQKVNFIPQDTMYRILFAISFVHLLNDTVQAVIPAIFPILQQSMNLSFFQLGLIGFSLNMTASVMQPVVGLYTDKNPSPYLLPLGMLCTFAGMLGLAFAPNLYFVLVSVVIVGSRGLGGLKELMLGSVSSKVAQLSEIPVLIIK